MAVASTGVIGVLLDAGDVIRGLAQLRPELREHGHGDFSEAIRTTDKFEKEVEVDVALPSGHGAADRAGQGRGDDLARVRDDALLRPDRRGAVSRRPRTCCSASASQRSFDRVSVDGQLSTNDTVILQASGESGVRIEPQTEDEVRFGEALDWALRKLALDIVRDGEGSKRVGRVVVRGGSEDVVDARRARGGQLAAGEGRAARRRPELGPDRAGRRRRAARHRAAGAGHLHRGRAGLRGGDGDPVRPADARRGGVAARRSSTTSSCPATAPRPRSSSPTSRTST